MCGVHGDNFAVVRHRQGLDLFWNQISKKSFTLRESRRGHWRLGGQRLSAIGLFLGALWGSLAPGPGGPERLLGGQRLSAIGPFLGDLWGSLEVPWRSLGGPWGSLGEPCAPLGVLGGSLGKASRRLDLWLCSPLPPALHSNFGVFFHYSNLATRFPVNFWSL